MSVIVEPYSEKAIVVRNTLEHHGSIMTELGGTFNEKLKGGRGWIFSKYKFASVKSIVDKLNSGQYGNEYEQKTAPMATPTVSATTSTTATYSVNTSEMVSKSEYLSLLSRVERLEALFSNSNTYKPIEIPVSKPITKPAPIKHTEIRPSTPDFDEPEEDAPIVKKRLVQMKK